MSSEAWKKQLEANFWVASGLNSEQSRTFLEHERQEHFGILSNLGLAK
jgi:tripartite-type tricarboxylate transporter receptor subunit TctC